MDFKSWNIFWSLCFGLLATMIVVGNILTIWIFFKQRRRKRAYILLISLAVADLLVGLSSIPLYMTLSYINKTVSVSERYVWYPIATSADVFTGITSISTLAVISLERMFAIGWPFRHRNLNFRIYICAIVIPWIVAGIFTGLVMSHFFNIIERETFLYLLGLFSVAPLLIICAAYYVVWKKKNSPFGQQNHVQREAKLAKTLILITGASLSTWLPFLILNLLYHRDEIKNSPYLLLTIFIFKLLQFSSSLANVIIYPFRIPEFKNTLLQILHSCVVPFQRFNAQASPRVESGSVVSLISFRSSQFSSANDNQETSL